VVIRRCIPEKRGYEYRLTPAGRDLESIVMALDAGRLKVAGTSAYARTIDASLGRSPFAAS